MWFCRDLWTDAAKDGLKEKGRKGHGNQNNKLGRGHKRSIEDRGLEVKDVSGGDYGFIDTHTPSNPLSKRADSDAKINDDKEPEVHNIKAAADQAQAKRDDAGEAKRAEDEQSSSDQDAIDEDTSDPAPEPLKPQDLPASAFLIPNTAFTAARILVNPRCVTTYGGVSHTQLALDLFGGEKEEEESGRLKNKGGNYVLGDWAGPPDSFVCQEMKTTGGRTAPKSQRRVGFLLQNEVGI